MRFIVALLLSIAILVLIQSSRQSLQEGDAFLRQSNYSAALSEYSKLGNDVRALIKKAEIYRLQRKFDFVKVECQRILDSEDETKDLQAHLLLAEVNLLMGDFRGAIENAEAALKLDASASVAKQVLPDARTAEALLASISQLQDKEDAPRSEYNQCSNILGDLLTKYAKESIELRLFRVKCALFARKFSVVQSEIKKIFAKDRSNLDAHVLYSQYLYMLGAADKSRENVRNNCLNSDPENRQCKTWFRFVKKAEELSEKAKQDVEAKNWRNAKKSIKEYLDYAPQCYNFDEMSANYCAALAKTAGEDTSAISEALKVCNNIISESSVEGESADVSNEFIDIAKLARVEIYLSSGDLETAERELSAIQNSINQNLREELNGLHQRLQREKRLAAQKDHYKVLGLDKNKKNSYTERDIKKAYRTAAMQYHPDKWKNGSEDEKKIADKKFRESTESYEVLMDPEKKAKYDSGEWDGNEQQQQGGFQQGGFSGGNPFEFFTSQGAGGFQGFPGGGNFRFRAG
jgi:hypothetical protein